MVTQYRVKQVKGAVAPPALSGDAHDILDGELAVVYVSNETKPSAK